METPTERKSFRKRQRDYVQASWHQGSTNPRDKNTKRTQASNATQAGGEKEADANERQTSFWTRIGREATE